MSVNQLEGLEAWQRARELAIAVYGLTRQGQLARDFRLRDQMQRSPSR